MIPIPRDKLIDNEYYLAYIQMPLGKILGIGRYHERGDCLENAHSVNRVCSSVFEIHPRWFGLNPQTSSSTELFKLDKDEILRHIVSESI